MMTNGHRLRSETGADLEELLAERLVDLGFSVDVLPSQAGDRAYDLLARHVDPEVTFGVRVKVAGVDLLSIPQHSLLPVIDAIGGLDGVIVGAPSITPAQRHRITALGFGWIDAAGNADMKAPGLRVHVEGRPEHPLARDLRVQRSIGWATRPTGLRVNFALLTRPELLTATLGEIADAAGVSSATVHHVLRDLRERGLLDTASKRRIWLDRRAVVELWVGEYTRRIAPAVNEWAYVTPGVAAGEWADIIRASGAIAWVSGGAALDALGAGLHATRATVYHRRPLPRGLAGSRLARPRRDEEPSLLVREPWWSEDSYPPGIAPMLLVYADALSSRDPRTVAIAEELTRRDPDLRDLLER